MAVNRYYSNTAVTTALTAGINNSVTSIVVDSVSGFPVSFPYTLVLDEEQPTEELVEVTAAVGTTLTVVRGVDNTSASTHAPSATVQHVVSARDFREAQEHIAEQTTAHGLTLANLATKAGTETLTNKTIDLTDNTLVGTLAELNAAISDTDVVGIAATQTLTGKTIDLTDNTLNGTLAEFSAAVSDADLVGVASSQTLTNKTLTSPTLSNPTLSGAMGGSGSISLAGSIISTGSIGLNDGAREIILGYGGSGGLSIGNSTPVTHPNGAVLWFNGTNLFCRKPGGSDVAIA